MPDITLHITTDNLSPDELRKVHRDIALLKRGFVDAGRAAFIFGNQIQTVFKQLQISISDTDDNTTSPQVAVANAIESFAKARLAATPYINVTEETTPITPAAVIRQFNEKPTQYNAPDIKTQPLGRKDFQSRIDSRDFQSQRIGKTDSTPNASVTTEYLVNISRAQRAIINTISDVPNDLLTATYDALITIPTQTRVALQQLKVHKEQQILEINDSEILSEHEKTARIEQIERNAAQRRKQIEEEANQAKIDSFNRVVQNFIKGIGRMIAEQVKLRVAASITNSLLGTVPQRGVLGTVAPLLSTHPILGLALGATTLFSGSFDDPINDALAQQAGIRQAQQRATDLGRRSAVDLRDNFERGFVAETTRQTAAQQGNNSTAPVVMNEIKLIIGGQEIKALYEETQRQIATGIITR